MLRMLFYNFLFVIDVLIVTACIMTITKTAAIQFSSFIAIQIDRYYKAKLDFLKQMLKDDAGAEALRKGGLFN